KNRHGIRMSILRTTRDLCCLRVDCAEVTQKATVILEGDTLNAAFLATDFISDCRGGHRRAPVGGGSRRTGDRWHRTSRRRGRCYFWLADPGLRAQQPFRPSPAGERGRPLRLAPWA